MPRRRVEYHRLAEWESEKNFRWYLERSPWAAAGYLAAIREAVVRIEVSAESFPVESGDIRWLKLKSFPYSIYFMILDDRSCRIYAVPHDHRHPGYWLARVKRP